MNTTQTLAAARKAAESQQNLLNSAQLDILVGPYGVLPDIIESMIEKLGNEKAALALHIAANSTDYIFQNQHLEMPAELKSEYSKIRDIVQNNAISFEIEHDITEVNSSIRQSVTDTTSRSMIEHLVAGVGVYNSNVASEAQLFTKNYLTHVAKFLLPENKALVPIEHAAANDFVIDSNENNWVAAASENAESVLTVDFGFEAETPTSKDNAQANNGYASREYQINADYLLALQLQMEEMMLLVLETTIAQAQAVYMMSMVVATAQYFTKTIIQSCQYQDIMRTQAAHILDQTDLGVFVSTQNRSENYQSSVRGNRSDHPENAFDQAFPALPPSFKTN